MKLRPNQQAYFALLSSDFGVFLQHAFAWMYPNKQLQPNWHIEAIVHALEENLAGRKPRLAINIPPRSLKSFSVSVAWPAFLLTRDPSLKIFCVSYSDEMARTLGRDFNRLVRSDWYRMLFPHVKLTKVTEDNVITDQGGYRAALSVHGSITGRGADLVIIDDPIRAEDALSDKALVAVNEWYRNTLLSRRDDKQRSGLILVMQRLHVNDLTGFVEASGDFHKLSFPAIATHDEVIELRHGRTYLRKAGEALQPAYESLETLEKLRRDIGPFNFAAQYQQSPTTPDGQFFVRKYFELVDRRPPLEERGQFFISIDSALSTSSTADFTAITVAWIDQGRLWVLTAERGRWDYETLKAKTLDWIQRLHKPTGRKIHVIVETNGSGLSLWQYLRDRPHESFFLIPYRPQDSKVTRARIVLPYFEAGVLILNMPGSNAWVEPFLNEFMNFPNGANDDQVDSLVQLFCTRMVRNLLIKPKPVWELP